MKGWAYPTRKSSLLQVMLKVILFSLIYKNDMGHVDIIAFFIGGFSLKQLQSMPDNHAYLLTKMMLSHLM